MTVPVSLLPDRFAPSASLAGEGRINAFRGRNCRLEGFDGRPKIVAYPGVKDLNQTYDVSAQTLTGTISVSAGDTAVAGAGTLFLTQLHRGSMILANGEVLVVNKILSDLAFIADRAATATLTGATARHLYGALFELDRRRAVLRRGNGFSTQRGDLLVVGAGPLFLDGASSGISATRRPQRLIKETNGSYTAYPIGYTSTPSPAVYDPVSGGTKRMQAGLFSFRNSWYNSRTKGFSNPSEVQKFDSTGTNNFSLLSGQRVRVDVTTLCAVKTFLDAAITIATGTINVTAHGRSTGDPVKLQNFSGALPVDSGTAAALVEVRTYWIIRVDADNFRLARTYAEAMAGTQITYSSAAGGGTHVLYSIPANADGIRIWQSSSGGGVQTVNDANFNNGPWLYSTDILLADLDSSHRATFETLDAELGAFASGDNDAPPECEFLADFANYTMYISCFGAETQTSKDGSAPGNFVAASKISNREAAPADWAVSLGQDVTGFAAGLGRLFCLTEEGLPFVVNTGRSEISRLAPTLLDQPFTSRPFWTKGGISPHQIVAVQGDVFLWSGKKLLMSPRNADQYANPFELTAAIEDLTNGWANGHVLVKHDPESQQLLVIGSATRKNSDGFWISEILPLDLTTNTWQPIIELSASDRDRIVSAAGVVNDRLEMLVGGRAPAGAFELDTLRYGETDGPVQWSLTLTPTDFQRERGGITFRAVRVTGRGANTIVKIHGARHGGEFDIGDLETGLNPLIEVEIPAATDLTRQFRQRFLLRKVDLWSLTIAGEWDGTGEADRYDEIVVEVDE